MISRRRFHALSLGSLALAAAGGGRAGAASSDLAPIVGEDGRYSQSWFLASFLELSEDLTEATAAGKRFALLWEQDGCPYCREMHEVNFAIPEIRDYIETNFEILQLDLWGSREVVDFDGQAMEERELARRGGVRFTPTIQFFPTSVEEMAEAGGRKAEIARMPGYFRPFHFLSMFEFVREEAYRSGDFQSFLENKVAGLEAEGKPLPSW